MTAVRRDYINKLIKTFVPTRGRVAVLPRLLEPLFDMLESPQMQKKLKYCVKYYLIR